MFDMQDLGTTQLQLLYLNSMRLFMISVQSFFDLSTFPDATLFNNTSSVWQPLNDLKEYMGNYNYPKYKEVYYRDGIPLTEHVITSDSSA